MIQIWYKNRIFIKFISFCSAIKTYSNLKYTQKYLNTIIFDKISFSYKIMYKSIWNIIKLMVLKYDDKNYMIILWVIKLNNQL